MPTGYDQDRFQTSMFWKAAQQRWLDPVTEQAIPGLGAAGEIEVANFPALLATASPTVGRVYTVLAPVCTGGAAGTQWAWDGSLWRPAGAGTAVAVGTRVLGAAGGSTAEQILFSREFQASALLGARLIRLRALFIRLGTADPNPITIRMRFGSTGSSSDATIQQIAFSAGSIFQASIAASVFARSATELVLSQLTTNFATSTGAPDDTGVNNAGSAVLSATVPNMTSANTFISFSVQQGASPTAQWALESASILLE